MRIRASTKPCKAIDHAPGLTIDFNQWFGYEEVVEKSPYQEDPKGGQLERYYQDSPPSCDVALPSGQFGIVDITPPQSYILTSSLVLEIIDSASGTDRLA